MALKENFACSVTTKSTHYSSTSKFHHLLWLEVLSAAVWPKPCAQRQLCLPHLKNFLNDKRLSSDNEVKTFVTSSSIFQQGWFAKLSCKTPIFIKKKTIQKNNIMQLEYGKIVFEEIFCRLFFNKKGPSLKNILRIQM